MVSKIQKQKFKKPWSGTFEEIPLEEREITHIVPRNEQIIAAIPQKVGKARDFLNYLHIY